MDNRAEVRDFLITRRGRVKPEHVGLPAGANRRVTGLRRSEVAALAGVSVDYYTRIERGSVHGVSPEVLDSLARALLLDDAERAYLFDLARATGPVARPPKRGNPSTWTPHPGLRWVLDAVTGGPAFVRNGRMDLLAANPLARALYAEVYDTPDHPPNMVRHLFLDERARGFYPDWDGFADITVAILRTEAARDPQNTDLRDLIDEIAVGSDAFRRRWGDHHVRHHGSGFKTFNHPVVGEMTLAYEGFSMEGEPGLTFTIYTPEPGTPSARRMRRLASSITRGHGDEHGATESER